MPTANLATNSGNILKLEIFSNKVNGSKDISAGVVECDYYESVLEPTVRFSILVADSGHEVGGGEQAVSAIQYLKLSGSEKVHLTIEDAYGNKLKYEGDNALYVEKVRNITSSQSGVTYVIDLFSREAVANELAACEVYRRFDGEISATANAILADSLKTKKDVILDNTANKFNVEGRGKKPFRLLAEIATRGVSAKSQNSAGYLFFETYDGFNFRSIDNLFDDSEGARSYIYNNSTELPAGYEAKIIRYDADQSISVSKNLKSGSYGAVLETSNTFSHVFNTKAQEITTDEQKKHGGLEVPELAKEFLEVFQSTVSKRFTKKDDVGNLPTGSVEEQVDQATEPNLKLDEVILQSAMTYNKLFSLDITIVVPGDYTLRAGSIIHADFPQKDAKMEKGDDFDKELSGLYIIADICTHLTQKHTLTKMRLVRDSYGRQPNRSTATTGPSISVGQESSKGIFGSGLSNPFSSLGNTDSEIARQLSAAEKDLVNRWNSGTWEPSGTTDNGGNVIDRTSVGKQIDVDLDAGYDDPNFKPEDYLDLD
jgi:hypothetical protein